MHEEPSPARERDRKKSDREKELEEANAEVKRSGGRIKSQIGE